MSEKTKYPSQTAERFQIRMPDGLRDRLRAAAADSNRSMNAEIIDRLERSFEFDQDVARDDEIFIQMQRDQRFLIGKIDILEAQNKTLMEQIGKIMERAFGDRKDNKGNPEHPD